MGLTRSVGESEVSVKHVWVAGFGHTNLLTNQVFGLQTVPLLGCGYINSCIYPTCLTTPKTTASGHGEVSTKIEASFTF